MTSVYDITRIPTITLDTFQTKSDSTDPNIIKSRDQLELDIRHWFLYLVDLLKSRPVSVSELRRTAGLDVIIDDYYYGFDMNCMAYTGQDGLDIIRFHPVHLRQIVVPNYNFIGYTKANIIDDVQKAHIEELHKGNIDLLTGKGSNLVRFDRGV